ncbi:hypothetical protein LU604_24585 [Erwinia tracheiphila]|uniref:hypothetical protein n=1 Tax=Erwinia tracheiphila TaxID=65700 RepID=UPI001F451BA9|nr:hypothetical protein [Erwinia tracheiphila]UIA83415.1 hypothetical protein LU604_24585 [Erwinia tracheiphila]UIA91995.1 hypothetical protein LU632_24045 [Erwinia tracheiphila]
MGKRPFDIGQIIDVTAETRAGELPTLCFLRANNRTSRRTAAGASCAPANLFSSRGHFVSGDIFGKMMGVADVDYNVIKNPSP